MVLHRKDRQVTMPDTLNGIIVEIDMGDFHGRWQRAWVNGKAMIFGGNEHSFGPQIAYRLIPSMMPKFELHGLSPTGQC